MNISSWSQISALFNTTSTSAKTQSSTTRTFDDLLQTISSSTDTLSLSEEGKALSLMPPPEKPDFESMTDEEFSSFLEDMKEKTGRLPGVDEGKEVFDLQMSRAISAYEQSAYAV